MRQIVPQQDPSVAFVAQALADFGAFRLPVTSGKKSLKTDAVGSVLIKYCHLRLV